MGLTGIRLGARRVAAFRRNCNCNVCRIAGAGEKRVHWPASPSRAMVNVGHSSTPRPIYARRSRIIGSSIRASPIEAVVLTGGEIDQTAGVL
jgi:phosphoribosyl 1,2-cyclic phosphodiesterase